MADAAYSRIRAACCEDSARDVDLHAHALAICEVVKVARKKRSVNLERELHMQLMKATA